MAIAGEDQGGGACKPCGGDVQPITGCAGIGGGSFGDLPGALRCNGGVACDGDIGVDWGVAVAIAKGGGKAREGGASRSGAVLVNGGQGDVGRGAGLVVDDQ